MAEGIPGGESPRNPQPDQPVQQIDLRKVADKIEQAGRPEDAARLRDEIHRQQADAEENDNVQQFDLGAVADALEKRGHTQQAAEIRKRIAEPERPPTP